MLIEDEASSVFVEILEKMLERAREGELRGLAVVAETVHGSRSLWASEMPTLLGAALYALAHSLMTTGFSDGPDEAGELLEPSVELGRN